MPIRVESLTGIGCGTKVCSSGDKMMFVVSVAGPSLSVSAP